MSPASQLHAVRVHRHGGPDVLSHERVRVAAPGPGEVRVRNRAIGLNFTDVYFRTGQYAPPRLPFIPGNEGAGEVVTVGEGVTEFAPGDRVGYVTMLGAYAEETNVPARWVTHLPAGVAFDTAAAMLLKGLTAEYLLRRTARVEAGQTVLVHAAAGGVGLLLAQWARHLGATVVGTVGSAAKAAVARQHGCDHVIEYRREDVAGRVREITGGRGCHVVFDSVGQATLAASLASLRVRGLLASYGSASGAVGALPLGQLAARSLFVTSPVLFDYLHDRDEALSMFAGLFAVVSRGAVRVPVHARVPLTQVADAHRMLEARETTGATVLLP